MVRVFIAGIDVGDPDECRAIFGDAAGEHQGLHAGVFLPARHQRAEFFVVAGGDGRLVHRDGLPDGLVIGRENGLVLVVQRREAKGAAVVAGPGVPADPAEIGSVDGAVHRQRFALAVPLDVQDGGRGRGIVRFTGAVGANVVDADACRRVGRHAALDQAGPDGPHGIVRHPYRGIAVVLGRRR